MTSRTSKIRNIKDKGMNSKFFLTVALVLSAALAVQAQDDDDLYFTPTKKSQKTSAVQTVKVYSDNGRDDDEYNRRYSAYAGAWQTGGAADSLAADTAYVESSGSDYDLTDPENDYVYSRRILRFHSPRFGFAISSPYYWDLVYGWGVYDYLYDPYYDCFYDPFYWSWGWGYGYSWAYRPWNTWYGPIWGWHHAPHGWHDWGWGPMWHDHGPVARYTGRGLGAGRFAENRFATNTVSRAVNSANGSRNIVSGTTTRTVNTRNNGRTMTVTTRTTVQDRTGTSDRNEAVNSRVSNRVSRNVQTGTSRNNTNVQNNRTTTVNNNRTTTVNTRNNTSVNTRNNSNATRTVTTPTRSTSTVTNTRSSVSSGSSFGGGRSGGGSFGGGGGSRGGTGRR